jgi:hypothetical protein
MSAEMANDEAPWSRPQFMPEVFLFYPSNSLIGQLKTWANQRGGRQPRISFERSLLALRQQIREADFVVVDATEDPAQASDALLQVFNAMGHEAMAVYSEIMHDGLELLVRRLGVPLLFGPLGVPEWDEYIAHKFPRIIPLAPPPDGLESLPEATPSEEQVEPKPYPNRSIAG